MEKAEESQAIKRARERLKKRFVEEKKFTNPEMLNRMKKLIINWLNRHSLERIKIHGETLFDENRHPEEVKSHFVTHMREKLEKKGKRVFSLFKKRIDKNEQNRKRTGKSKKSSSESCL